MRRSVLAAILSGVMLAAQAQLKEGALEVEAIDAVVTVTKVDREARMVSFRGPMGGLATLAIPAQAQNLDQVKPGQKYRMKYLEAIALEIRTDGPASAAATEKVMLAPKGAKPGGMMVRAQRIAGIVDGVDYTHRYLAVRGPKGGVLALKVSQDVPLERLSAGDRIAVTYTEALAVEMTAQAAARKPAP